MKKLSLVLLTSAGALLAACNGGGSSSTNSGGSVTPTPTPSPTSIPTPYQAVIPCTSNSTVCGTPAGQVAESVVFTIPATSLPSGTQSGKLLASSNDLKIVSITNTYWSNQALSYINFEVIGDITQPFIMNFTIKPVDAKNSSIPTFVSSANQISSQCIFSSTDTASKICRLQIDPNNSVGSYQIVGETNYNNQPFYISSIVNFAESSSFDLPLGTYYHIGNIWYDGGNGCHNETGSAVLVNTGSTIYNCSIIPNYCTRTSEELFLHTTMPSHGDFTNGSWRDGVLSYSSAGCLGNFESTSLIFESSSTVLPYPV